MTENEPLAAPIERCVQMVFPTPIATHQWPDSEELNAELKQLTLAAEQEGAGVARSNVGGWHSDMQFVHGEVPALKRLMGRVQRMAGEMTRAMMKPKQGQFTIEGWANLLRAGQYNALHLHPNSTWSIVYYVTGNPAPEGPGASDAFSGKIEFTDPRPGASATYTVENMMQQRCLLNPGAGAMIGFPSWLQHQVHPYFGPDVRISFAYNVLVT